MKLLDNSQIEELFIFTRQHFVEWYDVQTELVDHLANDIEMLWKKNSNLSFEQARNTSFKKFGVFGFMEVVEEKSKQMSKKYWRLVWSIFKEFFKIPQIIITATICLILFTLLTSFPQEWIYLTVGIIGGVLMSFYAFKLNREIKLKFKKTKKKWLLEEQIYNLGGTANLFNLLFQIGYFSSKTSSIIGPFVISILLTLLILIIYIIAVVLPKEASKILNKEYLGLYAVTIQ